MKIKGSQYYVDLKIVMSVGLVDRFLGVFGFFLKFVLSLGD